jgi:hypothetical protein
VRRTPAQPPTLSPQKISKNRPRPACAAINAILAAHAHAYGAVAVISRSTITRRPREEVRLQLASAAAGAGGAPSTTPAHLALADALLGVAFAGADGGAPCPDAAASLTVVETPAWLRSWAAATGAGDSLTMLTVHGYTAGQPPCGGGHGLGEEPPPPWRGAPARTVFLPVLT